MTLRADLTKLVVDQDRRNNIARVEWSPQFPGQAPPITPGHGWLTRDLGGYDRATRTRYINTLSWPVEPTELARAYLSVCRILAWQAQGRNPKSMLAHRIPFSKAVPATPGPPAFERAHKGGGLVRTDIVCCYPRLYTGLSPDCGFKLNPPMISRGMIRWYRRDEWLADPALKRARVALWGAMLPREAITSGTVKHNRHLAPALTSATMAMLHAAAQLAYGEGAISWHRNDSLIVPSRSFTAVRDVLHEQFRLELHKPDDVCPGAWPHEPERLQRFSKADVATLADYWRWSDDLEVSDGPGAGHATEDGVRPIAGVSQLLRLSQSAGARRRKAHPRRAPTTRRTTATQRPPGTVHALKSAPPA